MPTDTAAAVPGDDDPAVQAFRRDHATLNGRGPRAPRATPIPREQRRPADLFDPDATVLINRRELQELLDASEPAGAGRRPLAWTATLVLVVAIVAGLAAWVAYLYFTRGGAA